MPTRHAVGPRGRGAARGAVPSRKPSTKRSPPYSTAVNMPGIADDACTASATGMSGMLRWSRSLALRSRTLTTPILRCTPVRAKACANVQFLKPHLLASFSSMNACKTSPL